MVYIQVCSVCFMSYGFWKMHSDMYPLLLQQHTEQKSPCLIPASSHPEFCTSNMIAISTPFCPALRGIYFRRGELILLSGQEPQKVTLAATCMSLENLLFVFFPMQVNTWHALPNIPEEAPSLKWQCSEELGAVCPVIACPSLLSIHRALQLHILTILLSCTNTGFFPPCSSRSSSGSLVPFAERASRVELFSLLRLGPMISKWKVWVVEG